MKPHVYEGTEPYIFVSYAHRDAERVFEVLSELQERGYRFWYDDGIAPGSEWPEDIARHLDAAAMVMAFVTPNSMQSQNCRREINFSLSREKPFLSILLEETDMPLGMQMQLSAQQSILRYNYDSWDGFVKKILACPDIAPCRRVPEPKPAAKAVQQPAPEPALEQRSEPAPTPKSEPAAKPKPATSTKKLPIPLLVGAAAAVLLVVAIASGALSGRSGTSSSTGGSVADFITGSFTTTAGKEIKKNSNTVYLSKVTVTQEDVEFIAAMENLSSLSLINCDLAACDFSNVTFASPSLNSIDLSGSTGLDDFSFLANLPLKRLHVAQLEDFGDDDLSGANIKDLQVLDVSGTGVTDLAPLEGTPLDTINFSDTKVSDIAALATLPKLKDVSGRNTSATSIDALAELEELKKFDFSGCDLGDITQAFKSLRLESLILSDANITGLTGFENCTVLKELDLSKNKSLTSMDWLDAQNTSTLKSIDLAQTGLDGDDVSWLGQCANVTALSLDGIAMGDLSACADMSGLETLSAVNCDLTDISGLSGCPKLTHISLGFNQISDLSGLANLSLDNRVALDLTNNALTSLKGLPSGAYRAIMLYGNAADTAKTMPDGVESYEISTAYFKGIEDAQLGNAGYLYVVGCPQNQLVKLQDALGFHFKPVSEEELAELYLEDGFEYETRFDTDSTSYLASLMKGGQE